MPPNRLFLPHSALDFWLESEKIHIVGERLTILPEGPTLQLTPALHFRVEVSGGPDSYGLVGKVKSVAAVHALEGEHYATSVVLGDDAYEVEEGFLAEVLPDAGLADDGCHPDPLSRIIMEL